MVNSKIIKDVAQLFDTKNFEKRVPIPNGIACFLKEDKKKTIKTRYVGVFPSPVYTFLATLTSIWVNEVNFKIIFCSFINVFWRNQMLKYHLKDALECELFNKLTGHERASLKISVRSIYWLTLAKVRISQFMVLKAIEGSVVFKCLCHTLSIWLGT